MYTDKKKSRLPVILFAAAVVLICLLLKQLIFSDSAADLQAETVTAMQASIQNSAQQCFAVEGVYPPSLEYLQEHYGLKINTDDYYVVYEAYSSNNPPTVRVILKNTEGD